jgi:hypothetical protein
MDDHDQSSSGVEAASLSLSRAEQWTLHHVLVDRLVGGGSAEPEPELRRAFESLDAGETTFTRPELERLQAVVADYHHRTSWWEVERPQLEAILDGVSTALETGGDD